MVPFKMKRIEIAQVFGLKAAVTHSSRPGMKEVTVKAYNSSGNPVGSANRAIAIAARHLKKSLSFTDSLKERFKVIYRVAKVLMTFLCLALIGCGKSPKIDAVYRNAITRADLTKIAADSEFFRLEGNSKNLSIDGIVFITKSENGVFYLFRTFEGKAANFHGVVYSPDVILKKDDIIQINSTSPRGIKPWKVTVTGSISNDVATVSTDFLD